MQKKDFQDETEWVEINKMLLLKLRDFDGTITVPLTVTEKSLLDQLEFDHHDILLPDQVT